MVDKNVNITADLYRCGLRLTLAVLLFMVFSNSLVAKHTIDNKGTINSISDVHNKGGKVLFNRYAYKLEKRGDRQFIKGNYDRAFVTYEKAVAHLVEYPIQKTTMSRKMARLYTSCQQYIKAANHYSYVFEEAPNELSVFDVCNYTDILRSNGDNRRAEIICRHYAFDEAYNTNQRYMNTLQALSDNRYYNNVGEHEFIVSKLKFNTNDSEYYIDYYDGKPFYITSRSHMKDPNKIFYHQNRYYYCNDSLNIDMVFPFIPLDFQEGPIAINDNSDILVVTVNKYNGMDKISIKDESIGLVRTRLYAAYFDDKKGRWSKFKPMFPNESEEYSYAHPMFTNGDKSILFCSNRAGGYGGMDIYITHRNSDNTWTKPQNLGKHINTEANEIFPVAGEGCISFSSNGHVGNGGYDVYNIGYNSKGVVAGSLFHYPYPINSPYNDFSLKQGGESMHMISDRSRSSFDDIYAVRKIQTTALSDDVKSPAMLKKYALNGLTQVISGYEKHKAVTKQTVDGESMMYARLREGELLLTLYYEFDTDELTNEHISQIKDVMSNTSLGRVSEILVVGFADKLGSKQYNNTLSYSRADKVAKYLQTNYHIEKIKAEGRGRMFLSKEEMMKSKHLYFIYDNELTNNEEALEREITRYKKARKVDIIIKKIKN